MRSSEYKTNPDSPFVRFQGDLLDRIGEEPHRPPSIFSFFGPNYVSSGKLANFRIFRIMSPSILVFAPLISNEITMENSLIALPQNFTR